MSKKYKVISEVLNNLETELNKLEEICKKCHGNTMDDCMYCNIDDKKINLRKQIEETKHVFKMEENNNNFIISAEKARNMTNDVIKNDQQCLEPIMKKIREAVNNKKFNCYIDGSTPDYVISKLQNLGYIVHLEHGDPRDPREHDIYEIKW